MMMLIIETIIMNVFDDDNNYEFDDDSDCWLPAVLGRLIDILFQYTEQSQLILDYTEREKERLTEINQLIKQSIKVHQNVTRWKKIINFQL